MNPKPCSSGKRRFHTSRAAFERLDQILESPSLTIGRLYAPTGVRFCPICRGYHLTSKTTKRWKKGKLARDLRVWRK